MTPLTGSLHQTLDQRRAAHAWEAIQLAKQKYKEQELKKFGSQLKKLPTRIMTAGLGQALAFLKAKNEVPRLLLDALTKWVEQRIPPKQGEQPTDLLERIIQGDSDFLRRATDEVLAYLVWLNRFAEAEGLTKEEGGES